MMCSRIAIIAVAMGLTVGAAGIALSPPGPARATGTVSPVIERITLGAGRVGVVEGTSAPGAHVVLRANGRMIGHGLAGDDGRWRIETSRPLDAGDYKISVSARTIGIDRDIGGEEVSVALPAEGGPVRAALPRVAGGSTDAQLLRAGELAEAATKRFDEIMSSGAEKAAGTRVAQSETKVAQLSGRSAGEAQSGTGETRLAQSTPTERPRTSAQGGRGERDFLDPVWSWLERSNRQYQGVIVKQLSTGEPGGSMASTGPTAQPMRTAAAQPTATLPEVSQSMPASPLSQRMGQLHPASGAGGTTTAKADPVAEKDLLEQVQDAVTGWLDRANRQYQAVVVRRLSDPNPSESAMPSPKSTPGGRGTVAELTSPPLAAQPKAVEDAARLAEQQRREAEAKRAAEQKAKADEEARRAAANAKADADAARAKAEEDARRMAVAAAAKAKADAEARAKAEADLKARAAAEAKARAEEEARRVAAAAAAAAVKAKADAEAKARAEEEARRIAAAARAKAEADEKARADAEAKARAEVEARRVAAAAAARAKADAEAKRKAEADAKAAAAAAAVAAAAAARAEEERRAAIEQAQVQAKRVADAAKAIADRQAAEAARIAKAKIEQERRAAEAAQRVAAAAAAKAASAAAVAEKAAEQNTARPDVGAARASVQRKVRPASRRADTGTGRRRLAVAATGSKLKLAKASIKRVSPGVCRQVAGKRVKQGRWYVVRRGDSLWHVAKMHYNDGHRYRLLVKANSRQLGKSKVIYPCQRLVIPRVRD